MCNAGPSTSYEVLRAMGSVRRLANERVVTLRYNATGTMLACQSAGKMLEVFRCTAPNSLGVHVT